MKTLSIKKIILYLVVLLIVTILILAIRYKISPLAWGIYGPVNTTENIAIDGFDPTTYHFSNTAQKGMDSISYNWKGVDWHFISEENRSQFQADPEKYAPQFGGFCALAVSIGMTADANPEIWHVDEGKLYLFKDQSPKDDWLNKQSEGIVTDAEKNWAKSFN